MRLLFRLPLFIALPAILLSVPIGTTNNAVPDHRGGDDQQSEPSEDEEESQLSLFMRKKLDSSNLILEGLVTDDLKLVEKGCDKLLEMSKAESWRATNDMMYMQHSKEFRNSVQTLRRKAAKQALDGSALAWMDVTLNCIQCHEWVRDTMLADVDIPRFSTPQTQEDSDD